MTARIITSQATYAFPVSPGRKFVRLYFYPNSYGNFNASNGIFSVTSGPYTLLDNFSASQTTQALNFDYLVQEYSINVTGGFLNLTFTPSKSVSNPYAFVNGIEIVSMPDIFQFGSVATLVGTPNQLFPIEKNIVLENAFRINVGRQYIQPTGDSGLYRPWSDDSPYISGSAFGLSNNNDADINIKYPSSIPEYVAPENVYATARSMGPNADINKNYNLTWILSVHSNFTYLVRLHFCEIQSKIYKVNQRRFEIFINNQTAEEQADVIAWSSGTSNGIPVYRDYIVIIPAGDPFTDLWIALHPNGGSGSQYIDAILNGIEVFKLNNSEGNLGRINPIALPLPDVRPDMIRKVLGGSKNRVPVIIGVVGSIAVVSLLILMIAICRRRQGNSHSAGSAKTGTTGSYASSLPSNLCRHFSFAEIKSATNNFDETLLLGFGGFGKVYKGEIDGVTTKVAIKRGNPLSQQGFMNFRLRLRCSPSSATVTLSPSLGTVRRTVR